MSITFLVRLEDGTYKKKAAEDLLPEDLLIFDGPEATASLDAAVAKMDAEIESVGGLEAWKAVS